MRPVGLYPDRGHHSPASDLRRPEPLVPRVGGDAIDVVVGAGSGMGAAVAEALTRDTARPLVLADCDLAAAQATAGALASADSPAEVRTFECDITAPDAVAELVAGVPRLGSLVVTAGLSPTMADGERIFEVNLVAMACLLEAFEPAIGEGTAAVCFASMAAHLLPDDPDVHAALDEPLDPQLLDRLRATGYDPSEPATAYMLSKHGVVRLARRLAVPWGRRGARVNSLCPGIIDTPMGRRELGAQSTMQAMIDASAAGRSGSAAEVAAVAAFLCSPAASFLTGTDVLVDGGAVAALLTGGGGDDW